jgi:hypothetical protein
LCGLLIDILFWKSVKDVDKPPIANATWDRSTLSFATKQCSLSAACLQRLCVGLLCSAQEDAGGTGKEALNLALIKTLTK